MKVLCLRLSALRDTAASSTHRVLADLTLGAVPGAEVDIAFLPPKRAPRVSGIFTGRDWASFDLILVTNAFVQESVNLPWLLHANGLSPWAEQRPEPFPPLLLGGSNAFAAQALARADGRSVPDAFFFGEAEESLPRFLVRWRGAQGSKRERLADAAAEVDGFWVTGAPPAAPLRQAVARVFPPPPPTSLPPLDVETAGTVRVPVGAGCPAFCSFCFEGYERKPYRERPAAEVLGHARALKILTGARAAELDAFNLNAYAELPELVERGVRLFDRVSFKSQRADGLAACPELIDLERAAGKSSFTLGVEGISARLRAFLSKSLSDADLDAALRALLARRVRELKLFFILTAHETAEDLAEFGALCARLRGWLDAPGACTRVVLSFGRLVRMPNTPLAFDRLFLNEPEWRFCADGAAAACRRAKLECRFAAEWPDYLGTQLLAACRHEDAEAVVALACDGLSYHGPWHAQEAERLRAALGPSAPGLPAFPFVRRAVSEAFLHARWDEARRFRDAGYCLGGTCGGCGACASSEERRALESHVRALAVPAAVVEAVARAEADKRRLAPLYRRARLPDAFAGRSAAWVSASLMRHLFAREPALADTLLSAEEALFAAGENAERFPLPAGETVVAFRAWDTAPLLSLLEREAELFPPLPPPAGFAPGVFARAVWQVDAALTPRACAALASDWLSAQRLPHTLRRAGDAWRAELAPAALKRRSVFELSVAPDAEGARLSLAFSPKADLRSLLAGLHAPSFRSLELL